MVGSINDALLSAGKAPLGFLNPFLYQNQPLLFDVTLGDNGGIAATPGYDPASGLGTFVLKTFANLRAKALAGGPPTPPTPPAPKTPTPPPAPPTPPPATPTPPPTTPTPPPAPTPGPPGASFTISRLSASPENEFVVEGNHKAPLAAGVAICIAAAKDFGIAHSDYSFGVTHVDVTPDTDLAAAGVKAGDTVTLGKC
jgi:hypothetical protein